MNVSQLLLRKESQGNREKNDLEEASGGNKLFLSQPKKKNVQKVFRVKKR